MAPLARGVGEGGPGRAYVLCGSFVCALVGGVFLGISGGGAVGVVPSGLSLGEDLAAAAFFLALLVPAAVLVLRHGGRLTMIGFALAAVFAAFDVLAASVLFAPAGDVCIREEIPLVPALLGASAGLAQEFAVEECAAAGPLGGIPSARAALLLSPAALVALLAAGSAVLRRPRLLAGATGLAFLVALAGLALALVRP